ncbi:HNH endonuclease signature motif containing protein [Cronbergia sp. UHCC 0137]|uniref:HNH endonuclease n=1 Tax=Cronbergia sp. UHCC 0137 TaxID=3110239 RepID=UPI002B1EBBC5|nr:HNH endonuclease signature motif containing protein [Cronbergia sp. UHCC 0137]MEA5620579.1 HNH endonuclease signature motif containing protein [Cronbergia sp. UHCC 0137]
MSEPISTALREAVKLRAKNCCEYCQSQEKFATQSFSIEHIHPISKGGGTCLENLALACQGCNNHKYNKTEGKDPVNGQLVSLYDPRKQKWQEHFAWNEDYTLVIGVTPTGRATVSELRLNRQGLVNLRQVLYAMGEHPVSS